MEKIPIPISNVCLGGCTITTSKSKINIFWNFSFTPGPLRIPSTQKISKNVDFSLWGNRATTQTHIWNWNFFHVLAHCEVCWSLVQPSIEHSFKQELLVGCYRVLQYQLFWPLVVNHFDDISHNLWIIVISIWTFLVWMLNSGLE